MPVENDERLSTESSVSLEPAPQESLTDVIDQWKRNAFLRALDRRHATPSNRSVIESAHLVRRTSTQ
jgi:hypothetical protein